MPTAPEPKTADVETPLVIPLEAVSYFASIAKARELPNNPGLTKLLLSENKNPRPPRSIGPAPFAKQLPDNSINRIATDKLAPMMPPTAV